MPIAQSKYLIVVVGPTAVGKTHYAIQLAERFQTEIISADARQFYLDMPIGTAQPTAAEQQGILHHFMAFLAVSESYNAGKFSQATEDLLNKLFNHQQVVVAVGGSGLYIKALCEGLSHMPDIAPTLRPMLIELWKEQGLSHLTQLLAQQDPTYYRLVDLQNPHRIIRALEVCLDTGIPYSSWRKKPVTRCFTCIKIGLNKEKHRLDQQIEQRVDKMIEQGLIEEVRKLYPYKNNHALQTIGYKELFDYLDGHCSVTKAVTQIKHHTKQYAKRQLTWFTKDQEIAWFTPSNTKQLDAYLHHIMQPQR